MKKSFLISLFVYFFISLFALVPSSFAGTNVEPNKAFYCLKNRGNTTDTIALPYHDPPAEGSATKYLAGTFAPGSEIYAIVCGAGAGNTCTTGNDEYDYFLFKKRGLTNNVSFTSQKVKADGKGVANFDAVISGLSGMTGTTPSTYVFRGVQVTYPAPVGSAGNDGTQKQGTFNFVFKDGGGNCAQINWTHYDPYGVVFDAVSLEPIPGVVTTILDSAKKKITNTQFFNNDHVTAANGIYNYGVEPGTYYMTVTPPPGYKFEKNPPLNKNAQKVYNFEDTIGSRCTIYSPDEPISEIIDKPDEIQRNAPNPECRNIALTPLSRPYIAAKVTGTYANSQLGTEQAFDGKVTHPFTYIKLSQNGKEIVGATDKNGKKANQIADNTGDYSFQISNSFFTQFSPITVNFTKADLTGNLVTKIPFFQPLKRFFSALLLKLFHYDVSAESVSSEISIDLVPNFIEGFAYGDQGQIIRNAQVALRIKGAKADYYLTTADANGYFFIESGNLPPMEFTIEVTSPLTNKRSSFRMYEFAKANESYFTKNNINLITGTRGGVSVAQKRTLSPFDFGNAQNEAATAAGQTGSTSQGSSSSKSLSQGSTGTTSNQIPSKNKGETPAGVNPLGPAVGMVLILIFLIIVAGGIAAWAIMQKNRQQLPPMY
ncbi:hypothetical protein HZC27_01845 [Candidatus Roizmanbacteria bacterium]|nr:hypothetical protein [Candidatus Roizmanbacteria bacterium]